MKRRNQYTILYSLFFLVWLSIYTHPALAVPSGVYVGGLIGSGKLEVSADDEHVSPAVKDENNLAWRVYAGYKYNLNIAIEAGFIDWGDVTFKSALDFATAQVSVEQKSVDLMGKFIYPFNAAASIYAQGGVTYVKIEEEANSAAKSLGISGASKETFKPIFGIGGNYEFYPCLLAEITWIRIPSGSGVNASNFWGAGLTLFVG